MKNNEKIVDYNFEGQRLLFENSKRMDYSKLADNIGLGHRE